MGLCIAQALQPLIVPLLVKPLHASVNAVQGMCASTSLGLGLRLPVLFDQRRQTCTAATLLCVPGTTLELMLATRLYSV